MSASKSVPQSGHARETKSRKNKGVITDDVERIDATYKVLLLGDSGVGKTSLIRSVTGKQFSHNMLTTVGIDFVKMIFDVDSAKICLQIWDTAGQERFRSLTKFQYRGTKGLLLVYDVTNRASFDMLGYWISSIEKELEQSNTETIPVIIVGNKCDLVSQRKVNSEEGERISRRNSLSGFFETSAATGINVRECFAKLAFEITDINNPQLMSMYKYSAAIDRAKAISLLPLKDADVSDHPASPPTGSSLPSAKTQNGNKKRQTRTCPCSI